MAFPLPFHFIPPTKPVFHTGQYQPWATLAPVPLSSLTPKTWVWVLKLWRYVTPNSSSKIGKNVTSGGGVYAWFSSHIQVWKRPTCMPEHSGHPKLDPLGIAKSVFAIFAGIQKLFTKNRGGATLHPPPRRARVAGDKLTENVP